MHPPILETQRKLPGPDASRGAAHATWADEADCERRAAQLARHAALRAAHIALDGPLGAGKTTFARHLLRALGVDGRIKSPSYAVVEPYVLADGGAAWHFDFYRFADPREWEDAGFRDIFAAPGLKLVEWTANAGPGLPTADLHIALEPLEGDRRQVTFTALAPLGEALLP